ncbi:proteasome activator pa28 REG alpha/beta subunit [Trametes polyzona]|nr:proteasome activator pa28 REG alpha/beta subunit [Trametes polyzona]
MSGKAPTLDKKLKNELEEFKEKVRIEAERVVFEVFPKKVNLQKLIDSTAETTSPFHLSSASPSTDTTVYPPPSAPAEPESKKRKLDHGEAVNGISSSNDTSHAKNPSKMVGNKHTAALHEQLKRECEALAELCDKVKLWINLSMPRVRVQIQEDVLNEIHRSQESAFNLRDAARQDYLTRAKICSKIMKYPHLDDYVLALKEHDEKQVYIARQNLHDLRSIYAILTDMLHKNIEKIRTPKGNNASTMY